MRGGSATFRIYNYIGVFYEQEGKVIFGNSIFIMSNHAYCAPGWSGQATITGMFAISDEKVLLKLSNFTNSANCSVDANADCFNS